MFCIERSSSEIMVCERYLSGTYEKHNCANGWVPSVCRSTPQAFSHFTYCVTRGNLMIVDMQGVGDTYTDAVVLTSDGKGYGPGNIGRHGMDLFFGSHRCNTVCMKLALTPNQVVHLCDERPVPLYGVVAPSEDSPFTPTHD